MAALFELPRRFPPNPPAVMTHPVELTSIALIHRACAVTSASMRPVFTEKMRK